MVGVGVAGGEPGFEQVAGAAGGAGASQCEVAARTRSTMPVIRCDDGWARSGSIISAVVIIDSGGRPQVWVGMAQPPSSWRTVCSHCRAALTCGLRAYPARISSSVTAAV